MDYKELGDQAKEILKRFGILPQFVNAGLATPPAIMGNLVLTREKWDHNENYKKAINAMHKLSDQQLLSILYETAKERIGFNKNRSIKPETAILTISKAIESELERQQKRRERFKAKQARKRTVEDRLKQFLPHSNVSHILKTEITPALNEGTIDELTKIRSDIIDGCYVLTNEVRGLNLLETAIQSKKQAQNTVKQEPVKKKEIGYLV